jgi:hypothetical protein
MSTIEPMSYSTWCAPTHVNGLRHVPAAYVGPSFGIFVSREVNENESVSRLSAVGYHDLDEDFVRFRDNPLDDAVKSIVVSIASADVAERNSFRMALENDSVSTLLLYAKRRTLQARRRSSMNLVDEAMDAFALVPSVADVPWDTWVKAALFIARSLGRDIESVALRFGTLSTVESAQRFDVAYEAMKRVDSLQQCFIAEVSTNYGSGFIETIVHRDTKSTGAFYSAPRQADDIVPFRPRTNLAQLAASIADAFDVTGTLHTGAIGQDQLAGMSFSQQVSGAYLETTGCVSFYADGSDNDASFKVFVAELPENTDVEELATGAERDDQAVCFDDTRLILLLAPPNFDDDDDDDAAAAFDFDDYLVTVRETLKSSTAVGWHGR